MPAPISVIIPTLNAANIIGPCLEALGNGLNTGIIAELIIADGGSSDNIEAVADIAGAVLTLAPTGRGSQLNKGAAIAKADWLLFLHADTVLAADWPQVALNHMHKNPHNAAYFKLRFDASGFAAKTVAGWANWRSRFLKLPYGDQALLISRKLYDQIGGYADIQLMEDVQIAKALKKRLVALDCTITTSAARYQKQGWLRRSFRNFSILMRFKMGANPADLVKKYQR